MSEVVVLRRSEGPPLRLRARLGDVKRGGCGAVGVELTLWAREPVGWAVSVIRKGAGGDVADAMLCEDYEDICDALEALTLQRRATRVKPPKGGWTADSAADALTARLARELVDAALGGLVGEALADWAHITGAATSPGRREGPSSLRP